MSASEASSGFVPSIIDRLIDPESREYSHEQMWHAVRWSLENLLNTRPITGEFLDPKDELNQSIITYGLPDLTALMAETKAQRDEIARLIERTIRRFEPRLRDIHVTVDQPPEASAGPAQDPQAANAHMGQIQFTINGRLGFDPEAPEVTYATKLKLTTGRYSVESI